MQNTNVNSVYTHTTQQLEYKVTVIANDDTLEVKIEDQRSGETWRNTFAGKHVTEITEKAGKAVNYGVFVQQLCSAFERKSEQVFVDVMSSFDLESIKIKRGGQANQLNMKSNKRYIILSISSNDSRTHYPLPLNPIQADSNQKLKSMITALYDQLTNMKSKNPNDRSSSFMEDSSTQADNLKNQNEQLKVMIKEAEEMIAQKKGAVEMDLIIREKNDLELKVEGVRREENKEIMRLKAIHGLKERELNDIRNEINLINKELEHGEEANPKLKSHLLRVIKVNEAELNNSKKLTSKQLKEMDNINRNLLNCKNTEKKLLTKIKQLQTEIDQAKKKANVKQISNRLHSPASSKKSNLSAPNVAKNRVVVNLNRHSSTKTDEGSSAASKDSKPRSYHGPIRQNMVKPAARPHQYPSPHTNPLMRTTPALKTTTSTKAVPVSTLTRPYTRNTPPVAPRQTSIHGNSTSLQKKRNNYVGSYGRVPVPVQRNSREPVVANRGGSREPVRSGSKDVMKQPMQRNVPVNTSARQKIEASEKEKNIFNKIEEIKNRFSKNTTTTTGKGPYDQYKKK